MNTTFQTLKNTLNIPMDPELEVHSVEMVTLDDQKNKPDTGNSEVTEDGRSSNIFSATGMINNDLSNFIDGNFSLSPTNEHFLLSRTDSGSEDSVDYLDSLRESTTSSFGWSGDETEIQESISAIREEASRVDTIMAMDKLDTLQRELRSVSQQLSSRSSQLRELRTLVQLKDNRMSNLELERDLYKADADRFKAELQRLAENIHNIDIVGESKSDPPEDCEEKCGDSIQQNETSHIRQHLLLAPKNASAYTTSDDNCDDDDCEVSEVSGPDMRPSKTKAKRAGNQNKAKRFLQRVRGASSRTSVSGTISESLERSGMVPDPEHQDLKRCLQTSLETAEELRNRLGMVSGYYENLVNSLRESLLEEKTHRTRIQADVVEQLQLLKRQAYSHHS